jgi:hypothetical protein
VPPSLYEHEKSALVGGAGGEYGAAHGLWLPHFHLIAHTALVPTLNRLADRYHPKSDRTYHPVLARRVKGPAGQVSCCAKAYWPQVARYLGDAGKERRAARRRGPHGGRDVHRVARETVEA